MPDRISIGSLVILPGQSGFVPYDEAMAEIMNAGGLIGAEALIVYGETDQLVPPERSRKLQELFSGHTVRTPWPSSAGGPPI